MKSSKFWTPLVISLIVTPLFLYLGIASGGAGHGNYLLAKLLFPSAPKALLLFGLIDLLSAIWTLFALKRDIVP